jgi:hypothetical protein
MAFPKKIHFASDQPWSKEIWLDLLRGQQSDYRHMAESCRKRDCPELSEWLAKAEECRQLSEKIEAVQGEFFGPADIDEPKSSIVAISLGGHVIAMTLSDDGKRDAAFSKRYADPKYTVKVIPEPEAVRRYHRYIGSLRGVSLVQEVASP